MNELKTTFANKNNNNNNKLYTTEQRAASNALQARAPEYKIQNKRIAKIIQTNISSGATPFYQIEKRAWTKDEWMILNHCAMSVRTYTHAPSFVLYLLNHFMKQYLILI